MKRILVVSSANMDMTMPIVRVPEGGETLIAEGGVVYTHRNGICFETQYYPDALNHENFPSSLCKAGEVYKTTTVYKFL